VLSRLPHPSDAVPASVSHPAADPSPQGAPLLAEVISDDAGFDSIREEWDALLAEADATPFQSWEWQRAWWRHLGRGRLWIWTGRQGGRLVAIAPLVVRRRLGLPLREVVFGGAGVSDYLDVISRKEVRDAVCGHLLQFLADRRREWDMVDLQQLRANSPLAGAEPPAGLLGRVLRQEPCPGVILPGSWDAYAATLGKKLRSNIGYYERSMRRAFETEIATADAATLAEGMDSLFRLHQRRWHGRGLPGVFGGERVRAFHRDVAARLLGRDWLRLHTLRLDGTPRAALYCFAFGGCGYYYQGGFEPEIARYSPGTVLTAHALRSAIRDGAREFDFLRGDEPYKYLWNAVDRWNSRFVMWKPALPSSWTPRLIDLETRIEHRVKQWARSR
jgi:CelD/BcsL family acetyltransferase involved in cellulose biosynthesis